MRTILLLLLLACFKTMQATPNSEFRIPNSQFDSLPTIACPPNAVLSTGPFTCTADHLFTVTADDDVPGWTLAQTTGLPSGSAFPLGETLNEFVVTDVDGNTVSCSFTVTVEDQISPVCIPPAHVAVSCEQFDPSLMAYGVPTQADNCCIDHVVSTANYNLFDTICSRGTITRVFRAFDCSGNSSQCTQRVVVNYEQDYYIKFPNDAIVTNCNGTGIYGEPVFFGEDCELLGVSFEDEPYDPVPDACFKIFRTWTVINWCTYNPLQNFIDVPNPNPNPITNHAANLPGPIVSACGTAPPWASTVVKINPTDPVATDFCMFWSANANGYRYKQIVKILDSTAPTISNCPASPTHFEDATQNDLVFWNNVFNPNQPAQDLGETPIDLTTTVTDACSGSNVNIEYLLFLDLDADGQQETVVNSVQAGNGGLGWNNVLYSNINTPNYTGGTPTSFDDRPVPANEKWGFAIKENVFGNGKTASVSWNTALSPNTHITPELPNGRHKIKWFATDGCGNNHECERFFTIGDTMLVGTNMPETDGFALYQNEPNPFGRSTSIRFRLPESTSAMLSVFDAEGRLVYSQTADYVQGEHAVVLEKAQLASSGVLFYKLQAGAHVAWRKMVLMR